jgi:hypothetical protein
MDEDPYIKLIRHAASFTLTIDDLSPVGVYVIAQLAEIWKSDGEIVTETKPLLWLLMTVYEGIIKSRKGERGIIGQGILNGFDDPELDDWHSIANYCQFIVDELTELLPESE